MTTYKGFRLDPFQEESIEKLKQHHSVIVSAPTGSGKTLVAEYLIEKSLESGQRIFYTAPIKALNNQKFRQFKKLYGDRVGIMTGDVVINPDAPALMMTTEVYRNILFDDPERVQDVGYLILDEVHFLDDVERGTVWEESIIFSPQHIRFLALSASVPIAKELAAWITSIKKQPVIVVQSNHRPVPLKHLLFTKKNILVPAEDLSSLPEAKPPPRNRSASERSRRRKASEPSLVNLVDILKEKSYLPGLFFVFSRKMTEILATMIGREFDFTTGEEKEEINRAVDELLAGLGIRNMAKVKELIRLLPKGIAFHNAGMLPVLKIMVEDLFERKLVKALFATETFAVGINMPARSVIFKSLKKFDGRSLRTLHSREYFQMAGRAGRRGIDSFGHAVTLFCPDDVSAPEIAEVLDEEGTEPLRSQFDLSYNSVLNLARLGDSKRIEDVLCHNFYQFQLDRTAKKWKKKLKRLKNKARERFSCRSGEAAFEEYISFHADLRRFPLPYEKRMKRKIGRRRKGRRRSEKHQMRSPLAGYPCLECPFSGRCLKRMKWIVNEIIALQESLNGYSERHHVREFWKKVDFLQKMGYLEGLKLTDRGAFASRIHGYELQVTEIAMAGIFEKLSEPELVACLACIIHEPRGVERLLRLPRSAGLRERLEPAFAVIRHIRKLERKRGFNTVAPMETSVARLSYDWATGTGLAGIIKTTGFCEGDFIRLTRLVVDVLRQIKSASRGYGTLLEKVNRCMIRINRELVRPDLELGL